MKAALAEKLANDENEARRREEQVQIKDQYKEAINLWKNKNKVSRSPSHVSMGRTMHRYMLPVQSCRAISAGC